MADDLAAALTMKVLFIDIETSPATAFIWSLWDEHTPIQRLIDNTEMMCFAAKWQGDRTMIFHSTAIDGKSAMVRAAHDLLCAADVVVHYNGARFDIPHLNREFLLAGLTPPSPYRQVDLFRVVKRRFKFMSNKLEFVSGALGIGHKLEHEGFKLWKRCLDGDESAWRKMERYNRQDVRLLERLYDCLVPWIPNMPNRNLYGQEGCPACGGKHVNKRGFAYTQVSKFQRWQCKDCGTWFRSTRRVNGVEMQPVVQS